MQAERWRQIDRIFHSALNIEEGRRAAFLDDTCSGDEGLRLELEALLAHHKEAESFLESPAFEVAAQALAPAGRVSGESGESAAALVGQTISHYRILSALGRGGMGVVYEAEDIRLGRRVALKFLPEHLATNPRALQRFEREARAASSLNHANICTIYEVEEHNGQPVIVMELLEGETLKQRIRTGPIPTDELLDIGAQISDALQAAHARGIIHRDIKPANIFIGGGARVKVLDFGLAKVIPAPVAQDESGEESLTGEGVIAGTTSYMSPEQARGEEIDARSDLFSLGVVLYELATAQQPFARKNTVLTVDAILNVRPPAPTSLNTALPGELDRIIARMLEKDRELRYQHAADICSDLKRLKEGKTRIPRLAVAACVVTIAIAAGAFFYSHRRHPLTEKDTIVLAEFKNTTGDQVFDATLRQGLSIELEQSPFLSLVSDQRVQRTMRLMGQPTDARMTPELAREICERTGSAAVLEGSISSLGNQYVLGLRAQNCRTGDVLDEEQAQAARKEDVLNTLSQMASKFRTRAGESLATVEKHDTPLAEATTPSLEALKAYSAAWKAHYSNGATAALPLFRRATEIDPKFAMAHASLGRMYADIDESDLSAESISRAWQLRDRASDRERFWITAAYNTLVTGNLEEARQTCEAWARTYPREAPPHQMLAGMVNKAEGQYEEALAEARKAIELDPDFAIIYYNLAVNHVYLDRLGEAEDALRRAAGRGLEIDEFVMLAYDIAFLRGDQAGMEREAARARRRSGGENWISNKEAFALAYAGHLQQARSMSRRAVDQAQHAAQRERAGLWEAGAAVREAFFGNTPEARKRAVAALELSKDREVAYGAAFALALSGEDSQAQALVDHLERRFPQDTSIRFSYLPGVRARVALNHGDVSKAFELLQVAAPYELGVQRSTVSALFGALYPVYVRGEAYLAARQGAEAAAEFQKILDHRGIVVSDPIGALAHLQLGRALAMSGDKTKAKTAYQDFLTLWKDADPDIPIFRQAKAEYAKLR